MFKISKKTADRISACIKNFQTIAAQHRARDVSEADTVTLIKDILSECCGFDKYQELTSEQQIRGTFCDLAVKIDGKIKFLIEAKAAGVSLNDSHLRQAITYGANEGVEWVILTNSIEWRLHRIKFGQPIEQEEIASINFLEINPKKDEDLQKIYLFCKEGIGADAMNAYHNQTQILNKFTLAQVILSEPLISTIRREMRKHFPDLKIEPKQIEDLLFNDVLKREVIEGDKPKETQQKLKKIAAKLAKEIEKKSIPTEQKTSEIQPEIH